ncbi:diacylglycerol kinase delta isoform X2 [Centruroides vittatus]|uniref:diacylglycerol kinase delta isoform X2 n=1 Tax=Centruroides vittatus TaxID=120091 RepID=UPI0035103F72
MAAGVGCTGSMSEKTGSDQGSDESSESEGETKSFHRRISTSKAIKNGVCIKEDFLMKQTSSFQRWKKRYFRLKPRKLYYAKDRKSVIFEEIDLTDLSIAECSTKNVNHSFQLITPFRRLILCAESRKEMEDWISALKNVSNKEFVEGIDHHDFLSGQHNWYVTSHARPTYCNVCHEALSGVTSHGLSCEVCKFKVHKKCAIRAPNNCKWTTLSSVGKDIIEDEDGNITMPHQWLEGNLPVSAKCAVCDKTCGSVLRLQDWRCLWCRAMVHTSCKPHFSVRCPLGVCRVSIVPPSALHSIGNDEAWEALRPMGCSPLLVFVNSKSGDNQGVKFLRRFKQLLNPAQVFDLMNGGPGLGLRMFRAFNPFRILVCGGDGSVSWVLTEIDNLNLHNQCQVGVLPLGTGNDLARVLGWGSVCDDDTQLPQLLEKYEKSTIKVLDRWSIMTYEGTMLTSKKANQNDPMTVYEDSVVAHLTKIIHSDQHSVVISSAKILCETVKEIITRVGAAYATGDGEQDKDSISYKCIILNEKLGSLLQALNEESLASTQQSNEEFKETEIKDSNKEEKETANVKAENKSKKITFIQREALMSRANSLKKAVRQIIEHTERAVDEQNAQTKQRQAVQAEVDITEHQSSPEKKLTCDNTAIVGMEKTDKIELPIFSTTFYDEDKTLAPTSQCWNPWGTSMGQSVGAPLKDTLQVTLPTIEVSPYPTPSPSPQRQTPESSSPPEQPVLLDEPAQSPTASRRISSGSTLKYVGNIGLQLGAPCLGMPLLPIQSREKTKSPETIPPENREFPIINPLASLPMWPNLNKDSLIGKVLLANADALCAAASPLMDVEEMSLEGFEEKCVMNNYFGIGLDAKITLEFHNKREEHPEKCRSRTKNLMWYGVLGGKELLQKTFKNLEQRVQLECDGRRIPLPSLQGIVVLNIASYGGGSNFWGGTKEDDIFYAPSFDDKILEVVAVFGTVQMAASRVINLQHHRIAQCRSVKITILGDEGVPVQVDGEAWVQPTGYICIVHKNRTQVLCRNRHLESTIKTWQEKRTIVPSRTLQMMPISEEEISLVTGFVETASSLVRTVKAASISYPLIEQELFMLASRASCFIDALFPGGHLTEGPHVRQHLTELVANVRQLYQETSNFLRDKTDEIQLRPDLEERFNTVLNQAELELKKCIESQGIIYFHQSEEEQEQKRHYRSLFRLKFKKQSKTYKVGSSAQSSKSGISKHGGGFCEGSGCGTPTEQRINILSSISSWGTEEVALWLENIQMAEYKENFIKHDIRGSELLHLERRDLKELGVTKVGHIKRLLQAIRDITSNGGKRLCST